jgi:hypothetical protein
MTLKIGRDKKTSDKTGASVPVKYSDFIYDDDSWCDASKFLPSDFDLCALKIEGSEKTRMGWYSGCSWDGLKLMPEDKVIYWKRKD